VLCPRCRRQVARGAATCSSCGAALSADGASLLELVLPDGIRVPITETLSVGRGPENAVRLADATVSRSHFRLVVDDGVWIEDAGSSHGTFLDGRRVDTRLPVAGDAQIRLGDVELRLERRRGDAEPGRTVVVRPGATLSVGPAGASVVDRSVAVAAGLRPRVRSGWALKRLAAAEGGQRWVLRDLRRGEYVRMAADEAELFQLLDGRSSLPDLIAESERRLGAAGPGRLAALLADLGERGLLEGVESGRMAGAGSGALARLAQPRELVFGGTTEFFERLYRRGGFLLFTRPALVAVAALVLGGIGVFAALVVSRKGTPFVVASSIGLGGLVFLVGRFLVVALHELAHALTLASFGRGAGRAGLKLFLVFPFAFVDTSETWFEPRRRRLAVTAAGPLSDLTVGAVFALAALALSGGTLGDVLFQLALAAYVGALFNLNPLIDRDGYHLLVDLLGQPGLRRRSREHLVRRLAGRAGRTGATRAVRVYAAASFAWAFVAVGLAVVLSLRYYDRLVAIAPRGVVWGVLGAVYLLLAIPVLLMTVRPLAERWRRPGPDPGADGGG
jgi:putative peptide zinc metalloprotease protein